MTITINWGPVTPAPGNLGGRLSAVCQVTGRKPGFGKQVSHSHRRTSRRWDPNLQAHRYWLPSEGRWIRLRLSVKGMKTIDKRGIEAVAAELRAKGVKL
jgi:large subunit ribosomal protein L28